MEKRLSTSKVAVVRAKAKMTYYTTNQLGTSPKRSTPKTLRNHLKIAGDTKNQRGTWKTYENIN